MYETLDMALESKKDAKEKEKAAKPTYIGKKNNER